MLEVKQLEPSSQYNLDNKLSGGGKYEAFFKIANYLVWSIPININTERWWDTTTCPILYKRPANCYLLIQAFVFGLIEKITVKSIKGNRLIIRIGLQGKHLTVGLYTVV